jgi:uncharacterized protein (DUF2249 family)/iron-sulfur cluster repair protein YtfE (RIC family)
MFAPRCPERLARHKSRAQAASRSTVRERTNDIMSMITTTSSAPSDAMGSSTPTSSSSSSAQSHALSDAVRAHHRALAETLEGYASNLEAGITGFDAATLTALLNGLTDFLSGELLPHARGEEQTLYPALDPVIRQHGSPTATMRVDHEYIGDYARQITETVRGLRSASERERTTLAQRLTRQVIQLQALFAVHLAKEERVYLPLVEQVISAGDQQALLAALHAEAEGTGADGSAGDDAKEAKEADELEVRHLPPAQRHQVIFQRFNALPVGGSFVLVNDHDPKPLYYQLSAEYSGQLRWQYLEEGPEVWRVRMGKVS